MDGPSITASGPEEHIAQGQCRPIHDTPPGVELRVFVSSACGSNGVSTGTATLRPGAELPFHTHGWSEVVTLLAGMGQVSVEGREYWLRPHDSIHIPAGVAHSVTNVSADLPLVAHWAFATSKPSRDYVQPPRSVTLRGFEKPKEGDPEFIVRFATAEIYELSPGAFFRDMFGARFGSVGICGGYGRFQPGSSLPCHVHHYDESITIVEGSATCLVQGNRYTLSGCDTAFVPEGRPHRFINHTGEPMAMIWVYAGSEPERTLVDAGFCDGTNPWPELKR